ALRRAAVAGAALGEGRGRPAPLRAGRRRAAGRGRTRPMREIAPARTGSYPLRAGNRVRPLVDGEPAFRRICAAVHAPRDRLWVTLAVVDHDAQLPDGRGTAFDVLARAAARGLDVRVLFWREPELARMLPDSEHFGGTEREREWLRARGARFRARWDHLPHYCQ